MKILEVIAIFQRAAGTSVFCASIACELRARGHEVRIAIPDTTEAGLYETDVSLITIADAMKETWDIVHIHGVWNYVLTNVQQWAKANGIPLVWSPHGMLQTRALMMKWPKKLLALLLYQWRSLRKADIIHVCSRRETKNVRRLRLGRPMVVIPLGVEISLDVDAIRQMRAEKTGKKTLLYIGRINRGKGLVNLLKALHRVKRECPRIAENWRVVIAGLDEGSHQRELMELAHKLRLNDVEFPGPVYGHEKDCLYALSDLFVLPSLSENFGSVVIEALMAGVPVITTSGTPWQMLPSVGCGWYVNVGVGPLVHAISAAICLDDTARLNMGLAGRLWANDNYKWPVVGERIEKIYQRALK